MKKLFEQTPKTFLEDLSRFTFKGKIVIVNSPNETKMACRYLEKQTIIGIDTETKPKFTKGPMNKPALLQVSTRDICFLFRINKRPLHPSIIKIMEAPDILKAGLSLKDDIAALNRIGNIEPKGWVDLQNEVINIGVKDMGLQRLFANIFHMRISKNKQRSNWEANVLSKSQQIYAATDAYACLLLYEEIKRLQQTKDYEIIPIVQEDNSEPSTSDMN